MPEEKKGEGVFWKAATVVSALAAAGIAAWATIRVPEKQAALTEAAQLRTELDNSRKEKIKMESEIARLTEEIRKLSENNAIIQNENRALSQRVARANEKITTTFAAQIVEYDSNSVTIRLNIKNDRADDVTMFIGPDIPIVNTSTGKRIEANFYRDNSKYFCKNVIDECRASPIYRPLEVQAGTVRSVEFTSFGRGESQISPKMGHWRQW
jgi:hypothetical protein